MKCVLLRKNLVLYYFSLWHTGTLTCEKVEIHITVCMWSHLQPKYPPLSHNWEKKRLCYLWWIKKTKTFQSNNQLDSHAYILWVCSKLLADDVEKYFVPKHHFTQCHSQSLRNCDNITFIFFFLFHKPQGSPGSCEYTQIQFSSKVSQSRIPNDKRQGCAFLSPYWSSYL